MDRIFCSFPSSSAHASIRIEQLRTLAKPRFKVG